MSAHSWPFRPAALLFLLSALCARPAVGVTVLKNAPPVAEYTFQEAGPEDEAAIFTPPGFAKPGVPKVADDQQTGRVRLRVVDQGTGRPVFCRVNVIGPDGGYYEPAESALARYSFTGEWPKWPKAWGNRPAKAPFRYLGRFFYCPGSAVVTVPAGKVRVEVWRGLEYRPAVVSLELDAGKERDVQVTLARSVTLPQMGYWSGDPHVHIPRKTPADDSTILDLLEAEDIHFGTMIAYNEPAGPYTARMEKLDSPQFRRLGRASIAGRGDFSILSAQEYRSTVFGHLNLYLLETLVMPEQSFNANNGPAYGLVGREARGKGGVAIHAHGGYALEIYADVVQGDVDGVELLQFGVYRGIGLNDWYHMLNCGFRVAATGASDYPACRKLGDCITYVHSEAKPDFPGWLKGAAEGRSFITTGPLVLLEVDGQKPGATITKPAGQHRVTAKVRVWSEVAPVTTIQLVGQGRLLKEIKVPAAESTGRWLELTEEVEVEDSAWIAARAFSLSARGRPDGEAHTNPVRIIVSERPLRDAGSLEVLLAKLDGQIEKQQKREFDGRPQVLAYFEKSREILLAMRAAHPAPGASTAPAPLDKTAITHTEEELREFLKPVPPKPIAEALRSFETVDGFEMQPVATEPLVVDPIAAAFDQDGNLYVTEMRDYPYLPPEGKPALGTVRLLRDRNGDGVFDESHVFAENMLWAGGVVPWKGGVFVASAPDIWYLKDTNGDGKADLREKVFTGFTTSNQQAMVNNLQLGLDHRIYGSSGFSSGTVRPGDKPDAPGVKINGRDFRFDPVTRRLELTTSSIQFGTTFDDWGNRFLCNQGTAAFHAVLPQHYFERNPFVLSPRSVVPILETPTPIFRSSPPERWREIRSGRRIAHGGMSPDKTGVSQSVIDAAAGTTVYRGAAYPENYRGNLFIGESQNNLIHRRELLPDGVTFQTKRTDERTEFIRSSDNWFRPVNFVNAPDGTLYVLDMSREIIESIHIPSDVVKHLDLTSGRDRGRIYRIAPPGFRYPGPPDLGKIETAALVAVLENPNGWWRDTAHRLLFERQDTAAVAPLRRLLVESKSPQARLHALWSLHGLAALAPEDAARGLADTHAAVQEHALALAEPFLDAHPALLREVCALAESPHARVRLQAAFSLGEARDRRAVSALAKLARTGAADPWLRSAVLSSVSETGAEIFAELLGDAAFRREEPGPAILTPLAGMIGARNRGAEAAQAIELLARHARLPAAANFHARILLALGEGLQRGARPFPTPGLSESAARWLEAQMHAAAELAANAAASTASRKEAIQLLACSAAAESRAALKSLIEVRQADEIQSEATRALARLPDADAGRFLLQGWRRYTPAVRSTALDVLLSRDDLTRQFLHALESGEASASAVGSAHRSLLFKHPDATIQKLATKLLGEDSGNNRVRIITEYASAMKALTGHAARGAQVFALCSACHRLGSVGQAIGPDLSALPTYDPDVLLVHILDPNRYVPPNFETYVITDQTGRTYVGMIAEQNATDLRLRTAAGAAETILRGSIKAMEATGLSLMPSGLEAVIDPQQMADLLAYLQASAHGRPTAKPKLEIGTLPGLREGAN